MAGKRKYKTRSSQKKKKQSIAQGFHSLFLTGECGNIASTIFSFLFEPEEEKGQLVYQRGLKMNPKLDVIGEEKRCQYRIILAFTLDYELFESLVLHSDILSRIFISPFLYLKIYRFGILVRKILKLNLVFNTSEEFKQFEWSFAEVFVNMRVMLIRFIPRYENDYTVIINSMMSLFGWCSESKYLQFQFNRFYDTERIPYGHTLFSYEIVRSLYLKMIERKLNRFDDDSFQKQDFPNLLASRPVYLGFRSKYE